MSTEFLKPTICIISNEPWGAIWYSKQHYANELRKLGYEVFFVDPVPNWRPSDFLSFSVTAREVEPRLTILSYRNNFPLRIFPTLFSRLNDWLSSRKLRRYFGQRKLLWWQFDHRRFASLGVLQPLKHIYHVADPYMKAPNNHRIACQADLIVCTSAKYLPFYEQYNAAKLHVPHAVSADEFDVDNDRVRELREQYPGCMLLIGSVNQDVDLDLLHRLADATDKPLLIIGKESSMNKDAAEAWQSLKAKGVYLGPVHAWELKNYIAAASVCLVCYKPLAMDRLMNRSPLKILNYLAQYKPVVTSIDSEIEVLEGRAIYRAQSREEFVQMVQKGLAGQLTVDDEAVDQYLSKHTYEAAIETILGALNQHGHPERLAFRSETKGGSAVE